jgi:hypothetical protein
MLKRGSKDSTTNRLPDGRGSASGRELESPIPSRAPHQAVSAVFGQPLKRAAVGAFIAAWFLAQSWRGMLVDFTEDDLMNMYFAWILPLPRLIVGNLTPFNSVYRPVGSAFYRVMFNAAGFHPLPFRIAAYAVMLLNIWLVYRLASAVTGSIETGALCALIFSFHKRLFGLFVNGGTIYDILCCTFFCLAFRSYVLARRRDKFPLAFFGWYALALNSKEMAAALPAILLAYELIYQGVPKTWTWFWDRRAIWIAAAMTLVAFEMKIAKASSFFGVHDYDQVFTVQRYFSTMPPLIAQLFYLREHAIGRVAMLLAIAAILAIAALAQNRTMLLGAAILVLAPLPINFIVYRGFFVMYIPLIGWALWASGGMMTARKRVPFAVLLVAAAAGMFMIESRNHEWSFSSVDQNQARIREMRHAMESINIPKAGRVRLLRQPFDPGSYDALFLIRLAKRDPEIAVDIGPGSGKYDVVLDYRDGRFLAVHERE